MDLVTTYRIFLIKTLREKRFYWARNTFFVLFPLLFIATYIISGAGNVNTVHNEGLKSYPLISEVSVDALRIVLCYKYLYFSINSCIFIF